MNFPAVKVSELSKSFGATEAVKDVSVRVRGGEIFGLLGPNGAGKTTLIRLLSGLLIPDSGSVRIKEVDMSENPSVAKKKFALIPDFPFIYEKLTGWEFLKFMSKIYSVSSPRIDALIDSCLAKFNLLDVSGDLIDSYSHGMRQRLLFASVLLRKPKIIILDEPMVGLDVQAAGLVRKMLAETAQGGGAVFLSTHTLSDARQLCSRIAIMSSGRIIARGNIEDLREIASEIKRKTGRGPVSNDLEEIYLSITENG